MPSENPVIPLSVPHFAGKEWEYVKECLDTEWVSYLGPFVDRFEKELAGCTGARFAVATCSGTAALHVALLLAGVGEDDEVLMPGLSFVAPANAVRYCGAWPVFTDIREDDWQWDVEQLASFLGAGCGMRNGRLVNKVTGRRIGALLPVHLLGGMCDVDAVAELAARYELPLIEDAAECLGATYKDRPIGAPISGTLVPCRMVITSFNGNKIITTGGGGALLTDDESLAARARHLTTTAKADPIEFLHDEVGYNYRLTNVAAAIGVAQLENLDRFVAIKREIAQRYAGAFSETSICPHPEARHCHGTFWMYSVQPGGPASASLRLLRGAGMMSRPLWIPLERLPVFVHAWKPEPCRTAIACYEATISLPCSVGLSALDQERVIDVLRRNACAA